MCKEAVQGFGYIYCNWLGRSRVEAGWMCISRVGGDTNKTRALLLIRSELRNLNYISLRDVSRGLSSIISLECAMELKSFVLHRIWLWRSIQATLRPVIIYYRSTTPKIDTFVVVPWPLPILGRNRRRSTSNTITLFGILITCRFRGWMDGWAVDVILLDCCNQIRYQETDRNEPTHIPINISDDRQ